MHVIDEMSELHILRVTATTLPEHRAVFNARCGHPLGGGGKPHAVKWCRCFLQTSLWTTPIGLIWRAGIEL